MKAKTVRRKSCRFKLFSSMSRNHSDAPRDCGLIDPHGDASRRVRGGESLLVCCWWAEAMGASAQSIDLTEGMVGESEKFDLVIIGCGPAGEKAGAQAAYFGKRVAVIERAGVPGGSCINTGPVPSKTLRESALYFSGLGQRGLYGIDYSLKENLSVHDFMHHEREVVEMERRRILKNLELHKIEYTQGQASFEDAHTVAIGSRKLTGQIILISTGSKPN